MRKLTISALMLTSLFSTFSVFAIGEQDAVFSCTVTDGSSLTVKKVGNDYVYSQGKLTFKNSIRQVLANTRSEIAVGSGFITSSLELKNRGKSYVVGFIQARGSNNIDEPGVGIYSGATPERTIQCDSSKPIYQNFDMENMRSSGL